MSKRPTPTCGLTVASGVAPAAERFARKHYIRMECFASGLGSVEYLMWSAADRSRVAKFCRSQVRGSAAELTRADLVNLGAIEEVA